MLATVAVAEDVSAIIEAIELDGVQLAADGLGADIDVRKTVMSIASGETRLDRQFLIDMWETWGGPAVTHLKDMLAAFLGPMFLTSLFTRLFPGNRSACMLICACGCSAVFLNVLKESVDSARQLIQGIADVLEAAVPVLTGLSAVGGSSSSAALLTPMATLAGEIMVGILGGWGLELSCAAGACACACALGSRFRLDGIFELIKRAVQTGAGFILALFAGILKVQGMLGASFDSAAVKTARFAVDKIVPVVGGGISDTMDAALSSVILIKSAVGVTGMLVIAASCALPVMRLSAALIAIRLARAVALPVAESAVTDAADRFGDVIRLLVVLSVTAISIGLILTGAAVGAGRSIS